MSKIDGLLNVMCEMLYGLAKDDHDRNRLAAIAYDAGLHSHITHPAPIPAGELAVLRHQNARLEYENKHLSSSNDILRKSNGSLGERIRDLLQGNANLVDRDRELEAANAVLRANIVEQSRRVAEARSIQLAAQQAVRSLENNFKDAEEKIEELREELVATTQQLEKSTKEKENKQDIIDYQVGTLNEQAKVIGRLRDWLRYIALNQPAYAIKIMTGSALAGDTVPVTPDYYGKDANKI